MHIGELNQRVGILAATVTRESDYGGNVESWATTATVWAAVNPTSGTRATDSDQIVIETRYSVKMRYRSDVTAKNRISWSGKTLKIDSVIDPDGRHLVLIINCSEIS